MIAIVKPGLLTTVQDLGRPGYAHLGVPRSGALDAPALARANALVGNPPSAAGLETTLTGVSLRAEAALTVAVTGAPAPVTVDGVRVGFDAPVGVGDYTESKATVAKRGQHVWRVVVDDAPE